MAMGKNNIQIMVSIACKHLFPQLGRIPYILCWTY